MSLISEIHSPEDLKKIDPSMLPHYVLKSAASLLTLFQKTVDIWRLTWVLLN